MKDTTVKINASMHKLIRDYMESQHCSYNSMAEFVRNAARRELERQWFMARQLEKSVIE